MARSQCMYGNLIPRPDRWPIRLLLLTYSARDARGQRTIDDAMA
jgi:hypothetical protein